MLDYEIVVVQRYALNLLIQADFVFISAVVSAGKLVVDHFKVNAKLSFLACWTATLPNRAVLCARLCIFHCSPVALQIGKVNSKGR